ncbi:MAG: alpha/beta hydrolase [Pirellulales bacterium]
MSNPLPPGIEPTTRAFLEKLAADGVPPVNQLPIDKARMLLRQAQTGEVARIPADVEDRELPCGPAGNVSVHIVRPQGMRGSIPGVMYFHGGGWVLGDAVTHDRLVREIAQGAEAAVVFVNYSRSPEARYPTALEECYAATQWIAEHVRSLAIDSSRLAVAGDSAGGNLAAAVALLAKERGGPKLALQALFYPVTDAAFDTASYEDFADGPWLTREAMRWFWDHYLPDAAARRAPTASPLQATGEQLRNLPPAFIATAEFDVLRDEGEAYARKLSAAGVRVTAVRYLGAIHDVVLLTALAGTPTTRAAVDQVCNALKRAFVPS